MKKYKSDDYKPKIDDKDIKIRKRVESIKSKTGRFKDAIAKQAIEIGLDVIEKRIESAGA